MSLISPTKFGDCANAKCGLKNTSVVKVGKETYCLNCRTAQKNKVQITKANQRNQVRGLYDKQSDLNGDAASRAAIIADLDYTVSRIVRLRAADERGIVKCYCCPKLDHFSMMDASHFISRSNMVSRFDIVYNVKPCCKKCNQFEHGNLEAFAIELEKENPGIVEQLKEKSRDPVKYSIDELKGLLFDLRCKLKPLEFKIKKQ